MSRMWSAAATTGRNARARSSSGLAAVPSSSPADQMRLRLCTSWRLSNGRVGSNDAYAATLAKLMVSVPIRGRTPVSSRCVAATMPQISLPCVSALMSTWGPGWHAQPLAEAPDALATETVLCSTGDVQVPERHLDAPLASGSPLRALLQNGSANTAPTGQPFLILIEGHLQIDGALTCDDTDGATHLIVLGDARMHNAVVGGQLLYVQSALQVADLLWGDYNHGGLTVRGGLTARVALFTDEYPVDITGPEQVEFLMDEVRGVPHLAEFSSEIVGIVFPPE